MGLFSMTQTLAFAGKIFDNKAPTEPMIQMTSFKPSFSWNYDSERMERSTPEAQGVPSSLIHQFIKAVAQDRTLNLHNIAIVRNGKLLFENAFALTNGALYRYDKRTTTNLENDIAQ